MDLKRIEALLSLLAQHDVTDFSYKDAECTMRLRLGPPPAVHYAPPVAHAPPPQQIAGPAPRADAAPAAPAKDPSLVTVESPMVGTFYRSPSPGAPVFVDVGTTVHAGQPLCIVEAMKLMNEIESDVAGTIVEVLVESGHPVQFGQPLFRIRKG
jgi:acetyl-CoA carboxylase biotin carboxyl carrier protein